MLWARQARHAHGRYRSAAGRYIHATVLYRIAIDHDCVLRIQRRLLLALLLCIEMCVIKNEHQVFLELIFEATLLYIIHDHSTCIYRYV